MKTRLTELLAIEHPIMLAGMGGVSYAELTAAVSNAGGFGCLGASTMSMPGLSRELKSVQALTAAPFGVDLLTALPDQFDTALDLLFEAKATLFVAGLGVPSTVIERCHDAGVLVGSLCGKVAHAQRAVDAGCDLVIAQGTEAGGHTGAVATFPLVPLIVDAVSATVPVVAAGGIFDGRGLAAALALGADGVWVGTRFIATPEARAVSGFKERILAADETDTTITKAYSGKPMRVLRNDATAYFDVHPEDLQPFPEQLSASLAAGRFHLGGDSETPGIVPDQEGYPAGQAVGGLQQLEDAASIVHRMVFEAEAILQRCSDLC